MSNNETLADILAEMRSPFPPTMRSVQEALCNYADRIEAAAEREIPQPDPDWQAICEQCMEGDIEPRFCKYYGEPNGCNSPIYGEYPTAEKSSAVGNASSLRMALSLIRAEFDAMSGMQVGAKYCFSPDRLVEQIDAALAAPPRNCDVGTAQDQHERWKEFCNRNWSSANAAAGLDPCDDCRFVDCDANGGSSGCQFAWAQMPYTSEGGKK